MARQQRPTHPNFIEYTKFIVNHPNYSSLPNKFDSNGNIKWVSPSDAARKEWWEDRKAAMEAPDRASVARAIHPKELKGKKPCQICGKYKSIFYIYPNKNTVNKLNLAVNDYVFTLFNEDMYEIYEIIEKINPSNASSMLGKVFSIDSPENYDKNGLISKILDTKKSLLSPGVMSNAPDRLEGFHTYNGCCRSIEDTGRHTSNLRRYTQDRRVYENWAEGNWKLSNRVMGEFGRYENMLHCPQCGKLRKMSADHIGPISLGFTHRPKFQALCSTCNSQKNNRMTLKDVQTLLEDEQSERVVSWHSKYIWDALKHSIKNDRDALALSKLMRRNLHHVLIVLTEIHIENHDDYLVRFLHPEYSFKDYTFVNFHPFEPIQFIETETNDINNQRNAERYIRISYEGLEGYKNVNNRSSRIWNSIYVDKRIADLLKALGNKQPREADEILEDIFKNLALQAQKEFAVIQNSFQVLSDQQASLEEELLATD